MANKTFRKPHISTKDATGMCLYTTHKEITIVRCKSHLATKNHEGNREGYVHVPQTTVKESCKKYISKFRKKKNLMEN